ncbi:MAG: aminotransferase class V-fold PLP-dependent enzyme [Oscillospiraceae bacterium]|nr:aminotransferase class V-fold PLP-dependent enzyme [Oscillospiraceae bacterium]
MIYLDSAATTLLKPPAVAAACSSAIGRMASPGRGAHRAAMLAAETVLACRVQAARMFGVDTPEQVVLTFNATHGLNIAIKSLVKPGSQVLISGYEHNAVTKPLTAIPNVRVRVAQGPLFRPDILLQRFRQLLRGDEAAVICTHVSNVFGYVLPVDQVAQLCRERGVPLIVDASQSAGCLPVSLGEWGAAFVVMPGHKGLHGPQGTGLLLCKSDNVQPLIDGGTGSNSHLPGMPDFLPDRLEAGTHNVPGAAGLLEGMRFVERQGIGGILARERRLALTAAGELEGLPGVQVFARPGLVNQTGVLSFRHSSMDCESIAAELSRRDIAVRAGVHCAPLAHKTAGTLDSGTVRISFSPFNRESHVTGLIQALTSVLA